MARFALFFILASCVCSGAFGRPRVDRRTQMTYEEKLSDTRLQFENFKKQFNRIYSSLFEESQRFEIFSEALGTIEELNLLEGGTAKYGVTNMTDWTEEEFLERQANLKPEKLDSLQVMPEINFVAPSNAKIPSEFDWRTKNVVTPVKDQGSCGSCWAFCTVSQIETGYAIKHGSMKNLSEQQLVDCDKKSSGCNGGWPTSAIQSIIDKGGLNLARSYPYTGRQGSCRFNPSNVGATVSKTMQLRSNDEKGMCEFIATTGSTINAINARLLQYYKSGIIAPARRCSNSRNAVNHAVNMVGYGQDQNKPYWIGKNSWGPNWGENGYFKIARGSNTCGLANYIYAAEVN